MIAKLVNTNIYLQINVDKYIGYIITTIVHFSIIYRC